MDIDFEKIIPPFLRDSKVFNVNVTDMGGNYIYVNPVFQNRFSFLSEDLIGVYSMDTIYHEDHLECYRAVEELMTNPQSIVDVALRKPNGKNDFLEWTNWEFSMLFDDHNNPVGMLCVGYAITELKKSVKELEDKNKKLQEIAHAQAHELRGPLTTLQMVLDLIKSKGLSAESSLSLLDRALAAVDIGIKKIVNMTVNNEVPNQENYGELKN